MKTRHYIFFAVIAIVGTIILNSCTQDNDPDTVHFKVTANFTISPATGNTTTEFLFDASNTVIEGEYATVTYDWNFGEGNTLYGGNVQEGHQYNNPGEYVVKLVVKAYKEGNTGSAGDDISKSVIVTQQ